MGVYTPAVRTNKKHQSHFWLWCKHFYALAYAPPGKPVKKSEPNILTRCAGQKPRSFRKAFPAPASDRRTCANRKEHTPYSAVSASGIHTPFLCTRAKVPARALFLYAHILFWVKIILPISNYTPLFYFVKVLTLKGDNLHKFTHKMLFTLDL